MNLSWHIAKKDIRRFWVPLLVVSAVTLTRLIVGLCLLRSDGGDLDWFRHMAIYANVLGGIGLFLTYMLVGSVIHEDSVVSEAFWRTRPISGARLLCGKALGIFLMFGLLPVLLLVPWWLAFHFGWPEIWRAAAQTLAIQLGVVLLALPWSVVTRDDGRFLLWTVVVAVAVMTGILVVVGRTHVAQPDVMHRLGMARALAVVSLVAAGSICVTIWQFATRRTPASVVLIAMTALAIASIDHWENWSIYGPWLPKISSPSAAAGKVTISFEDARDWLSPEGYGTGQVELAARSVPADDALLPLFSEQRLRWDDGSFSDSQARFEQWATVQNWTLDSRLLRLAARQPDRDFLEFRTRRFLVPRGAENASNSGKYPEHFEMTLSPETMTRLLGERPVYDATVWFRLVQPVLVGEQDARMGVELSSEANVARLVAIQPDRDKQDLWLTFIELSPEFIWSDFLEAANLAARPLDPAYILVYGGRTAATHGTNASGASALIGNVSISSQKYLFMGRSRWNSAKHVWEKKAGDFDGATIAEVDYREIERFSFPIKGQFPLRLTSRDAASSPRGKYSVSGEVSKPGEFDIGPGETVINGLRTAWGVSDRADLHRVELSRKMPDGSRSTRIVDVQSWLEGDSRSLASFPVLQPGDEIHVPLISAEHSP